MVPNATVFTRMPSLAYSIASALVTASKYAALRPVSTSSPLTSDDLSFDAANLP